MWSGKHIGIALIISSLYGIGHAEQNITDTHFYGQSEPVYPSRMCPTPLLFSID